MMDHDKPKSSKTGIAVWGQMSRKIQLKFQLYELRCWGSCTRPARKSSDLHHWMDTSWTILGQGIAASWTGAARSYKSCEMMNLLSVPANSSHRGWQWIPPKQIESNCQNKSPTPTFSPNKPSTGPLQQPVHHTPKWGHPLAPCGPNFTRPKTRAWKKQSAKRVAWGRGILRGRLSQRTKGPKGQLDESSILIVYLYL